MKQIDRLPDVGVCMDSSFTIGQKKGVSLGGDNVFRLNALLKRSLALSYREMLYYVFMLLYFPLSKLLHFDTTILRIYI